MRKTVEIKMVPTGFEVVTGRHTHSYRCLDDALTAAQEWLHRAQQIRELSNSID